MLGMIAADLVMINDMHRMAVKGIVFGNECQRTSCPFPCIDRARDSIVSNALAQTQLAVFSETRAGEQTESDPIVDGV
jgi:hypothetical protein